MTDDDCVLYDATEVEALRAELARLTALVPEPLPWAGYEGVLMEIQELAPDAVLARVCIMVSSSLDDNDRVPWERAASLADARRAALAAYEARRGGKL